MDKEQDDAFIKLKEMFLSAPVIQMPDTTKPFFITTNASLTATGGVLMQKNSNGDLHPCAYHSATFSPAERNYNIYDRELLAVIQALKEWHHYLMGATVEEPPIPFSPFSSADCTMLNHFSFNDFIAIAFPDIAGDLDTQI